MKRLLLILFFSVVLLAGCVSITVTNEKPERQPVEVKIVTPTPMLIRLTIVNKSGYDVYLKLVGSEATNAFYYIVVPAGTKQEPVTKVYRIIPDVYQRTTWSCDGIKSEGTLKITGPLRLTFAPCGDITPPPPKEVEEEGRG